MEERGTLMPPDGPAVDHVERHPASVGRVSLDE